ncbi:hypothetical protein ABIC51_001990 [Burkholderia sp. 572]
MADQKKKGAENRRPQKNARTEVSRALLLSCRKLWTFESTVLKDLTNLPKESRDVAQ